jgi:hypothetical protein
MLRLSHVLVGTETINVVEGLQVKYIYIYIYKSLLNLY